MSLTWDVLPGNYGAMPRTITRHFLCHGAIVKGRIYTLDLETAVSGTGYMATTTAAAAVGATEAVRVVALEAVTSGQATAGYRGLFALQGAVEVLDSGTVIAKEVAFTCDASGDIVVAATADAVLGNTLAATNGDGDNGTLGVVWFYGAKMSGSATV